MGRVRKKGRKKGPCAELGFSASLGPGISALSAAAPPAAGHQEGGWEAGEGSKDLCAPETGGMRGKASPARAGGSPRLLSISFGWTRPLAAGHLPP